MLLMHYEADLSIKFICEAHSIGIWSVLVHGIENENEIPIACASMSLPKYEYFYLQILRATLALIYDIKKVLHIYTSIW